MKRIASIDIGSQTIRLLIADCNARALYPRERDREIVRLGSGMQDDGMLQPDRIEQAAACMQLFYERARRQDAGEILAVATACVRQARNQRTFLERVQGACGHMPDVLDGRREAWLACCGVLGSIKCPAPSSVIIDIGGGSTELAAVAYGSFQHSVSLPIGVIAASERFMRSDPPSEEDIAALREWIQHKLTDLAAHYSQTFRNAGSALIATAGTATTLAAMDLRLGSYLPDLINGHVLTGAAISALLDDMVSKPLVQRSLMPGLEPGRAAVIIAGAMILQQLMLFFKSADCTVSDSGLLEGIILDHASIKRIIEKS